MIGHKNNRTKGTNNAPIPEDNEQYCFRMPLKLEVHKRYWTTRKKCRVNGCINKALNNCDSPKDRNVFKHNFGDMTTIFTICKTINEAEHNSNLHDVLGE